MLSKIEEASYAGNLGVMELVKFHQTAPVEKRKQLDQLIKSKKNKEAWDLVQKHLGVQLHKSVYESEIGPLSEEATNVTAGVATHEKPMSKMQKRKPLSAVELLKKLEKGSK